MNVISPGAKYIFLFRIRKILVLRKSYIISPTGHISNEGLIFNFEYKNIIKKPVKKPSRVLPESPKKIFGSFKK